MQQQHDRSQEEISRLKKENLRLAARMNWHPAAKHDRPNIFVNLAVILTVAILSAFLHYSIAHFSSDQTASAPASVCQTLMDQKPLVNSESRQSNSSVKKRHPNSIPRHHTPGACDFYHD